MIDSGWVAAGAAIAAAGVVVWQSWETRRSAQASERAVATANQALELSRQQAAEAVRARIDAATPAISVFVEPEVDWPPLEPSLYLGGEPNPIRSGLRDEPMHTPRDQDRRIMVRAWVEIRNDSDRHVRLEVYGLLAPDGVTPLPSPLDLKPRGYANGWCAATHTLMEWIEIYQARAQPAPGYTSDEVVGSVHHLDPADTGANDRWDLIVSGTIVEPVADLNGAWTVIGQAGRNSGDAGSIRTGMALRRRRYYLSKSRNHELAP
ncbi:hypothetical protein [Cellulomonas hominis]|uniref:hypothetical protein n=1 Tax=Cellulomonas hominis TaxID=156981 RepID=UPI001BD17B98|nr:hypothetical protein [Cellulomonas hominis]